MTTTDPDALAALLREREDERRVLRRLYAYAHTIDAPDRERWLDCFTADGTFRAASEDAGAPVFEVTGQAALRDFIVAHGRRREGVRVQHLVLHPLIDVDGDTARASSYLIVLGGERGGPTMVRMFGRYDDRLVRCPDGEWRFAVRSARTDAVHADAPSLSPNGR